MGAEMSRPLWNSFLPVKGELRQPKPNQLLLLDVGYFLRAQGEASDKALATQALLAIDPESPAIAAQSAQLFRFVHAAAQDLPSLGPSPLSRR